MFMSALRARRASIILPHLLHISARPYCVRPPNAGWRRSIFGQFLHTYTGPGCVLGAVCCAARELDLATAAESWPCACSKPATSFTLTKHYASAFAESSAFGSGMTRARCPSRSVAAPFGAPCLMLQRAQSGSVSCRGTSTEPQGLWAFHTAHCTERARSTVFSLCCTSAVGVLSLGP